VRHLLCVSGEGPSGARCRFATRSEGPAGPLLDPRRRQAGPWQVERPGQAAAGQSQGVRLRLHQLPAPAASDAGQREKFGNEPAKHRDFSAVTRVARGKGIPPFLTMHVAEHPDTSAQAQRLANALKVAGIPVRVFGARESTHNRIDAYLDLPNNPGTQALFEFVAEP
jgi:acetyl esterase/lipase